MRHPVSTSKIVVGPASAEHGKAIDHKPPEGGPTLAQAA